jgi:hypothetical protein
MGTAIAKADNGYEAVAPKVRATVIDATDGQVVIEIPITDALAGAILRGKADTIRAAFNKTDVKKMRLKNATHLTPVPPPVEIKPIPPFVSIKRWCDDFSESRSGFYNRVRAGEVKVIKNGRRVLIPREEYLNHRAQLEALR